MQVVKTFIVTGLLIAVASTSVTAQSPENDVGVGAQIGDPSGITLKINQDEGMSWEFLGAYDLNDFFFLNGHGLIDHPLGDDQPFYVHYGPGAFIGIIDRPSNLGDDVSLGISGALGLNYYIDQFEIFLRVTPRLAVLPATNGELGGGVGFRYYP